MKYLAFAFFLFISVRGKIYKRCELAEELKYKHNIDSKEIPVWVCIAKHESNFNTSAVNLASGDHGLFQISDLYWCGVQSKAGACYSHCGSFEDEDLSDDLRCVRRIFNEHKRLSGNGFNAWVVYPLYCKGDTAQYVEGCFQKEAASTTREPQSTTEDTGDGYEFPPLPVFQKQKSEVISPILVFEEDDLIFL